MELLDIDVSTPIMAPWFNPLDWPPSYFPAGSPLRFKAIWRDNRPSDPITPGRFDWTVIRLDTGHLVASGRGEEWCWSGEGFQGGSCGDTTPKCYRVICRMLDQEGSLVGQVEHAVWAVNERACRR